MEDRPIQRLSDEIIGKIAAGEVVESPASAIKELVENSLDAGATCVTVEIRDGGISYLRVTDNGRGIPSRDVRLAFEILDYRYNSKLTTIISSEMTLEDIRDLDFALYRRISEMCGPYKVNISYGTDKCFVPED